MPAMTAGLQGAGGLWVVEQGRRDHDRLFRRERHGQNFIAENRQPRPRAPIHPSAQPDHRGAPFTRRAGWSPRRQAAPVRRTSTGSGPCRRTSTPSAGAPVDRPGCSCKSGWVNGKRRMNSIGVKPPRRSRRSDLPPALPLRLSAPRSAAPLARRRERRCRTRAAAAAMIARAAPRPQEWGPGTRRTLPWRCDRHVSGADMPTNRARRMRLAPLPAPARRAGSRASAGEM